MADTQRFEFDDGKSRKFWEISVDGKSFTARWGKLGSEGQSKQQQFKSPAAAREAADKLIRSKLQKGYAAAGAQGDGAAAEPGFPRNPSMEAAIAKRPDDKAARSVYGDWLQSQGSPVGELIAVQIKLADKADKKLKKREAELLNAFDLPEPELATFGLRWGLLEWIRLENSRDWMDDTFEALPLAEQVFSSPLCVAPQELRIGVLRWEHNHEDVPAVLARAGKYPFAKTLKRLHLGDVDEDVDMAHHVVGVVGKVISKSFPGLRWLTIHSSEQSWRGPGTYGVAGLDLPELEELHIETCSMNKTQLKALLAAKLPRLEKFALWFGSQDQGVNVALKDLRPVLDGKLFPRLKALGLCNTELANALAAALPNAKIAGRLEELDLSLGTLDDVGAAALIDGRAAFKQLKRLNVDDNFLAKASLSRLKQAYSGCEVISKSQKTGDADDDYRYVSVAE